MAEFLADLAYGTHPRQRLDLFLPESDQPRLFVFVHGGGWRSGDKQQYRPLGELLANFGYAVALPNHRLAPEHVHPTGAEDVAAALGCVLRTAEESGIRRDGIILAGHSSGAHLAALVALHPKVLPAVGVQRPQLGGLICVSGIYDLGGYRDTEGEAGASAYLEPVFGADEDAWMQASPISYAAKGAPPALLAHAEFDYPGAAEQAEAMAAAMNNGGGAAEVVAVPGRNHVSILTEIRSLFDPLAMSMALFLRSVAEADADH